MVLYEWQKECLKKWEAHQFSGIANVITGAGKTVLAISAIGLLEETLKEKKQKLRVRIVVPTTGLAHQWKIKLEEHLPHMFSEYEIGLFGGSRRDPYRRFCMIYVVNSARYSITRHIREDLQDGYHVLLIADECHRYTSPENRKIFDYRSFSSDSLLHVHTLGLSATPECAEYDSILKPALGDEIYRYGFEEGVKGHTINSYRLGQIALSFTAQELARYDGITSKMNAISRQLREEYPSLKALHPSAFFQLIRHLASEEEELPAQYLSLAFLRAGISQNASARISCSAALIRLLDPQEQILIFCERISQAEELYHRFHNSGYGKTVRYHSGLTKELRHISLDQFQTGEARILISCKALDEGVDVPAVNIGIVLSCTAQSRQRIQRLGRILRKNAKNNSAVLYYLHVKESADDSAYLPDRTDPSRIFSLEYSLSEDSFLNHAYEAQAANLWAEAMERFPNEADKLEELRSCLIEGLVRQDWMETVSYCNDKILHVSNQHARNYWICMKRISASRTSTSDHSKSVS